MSGMITERRRVCDMIDDGDPMVGCKICKKTLPRHEFYDASAVFSWDNKRGHRDRCITCWNAMAKFNKKGYKTRDCDLINGEYVPRPETPPLF